MITALSLLITPARTWDRIAKADRPIWHVLLLALLPLLLLSCAAEGYALIHWGEKSSEFGDVITTSKDLAIRHETVQIALGLVLVFLGSKFILWVGEGFNFEPDYKQCFTLVAYSASPVFLARFLDSLPAINTWICWTIGALGMMSVLYQGIAFVMQPSPTKGFGLYLLSAIVLVPLSGICHLLALSVLHGKISF